MIFKYFCKIFITGSEWPPLTLTIKGGYLAFSHLTKLKNINITEIFMKETIQIIFD